MDGNVLGVGDFVVGLMGLVGLVGWFNDSGLIIRLLLILI